MVYYFKSSAVTPAADVYVGKDKFENETLIKYGWERDVWVRSPDPDLFHVDNLSSAHVYLRMQEGQEWDQIPEDLLTDLAQLTKANSIEGNKKNNITVVYTPWSNLRKTGDMVAGQVSFHSAKRVKKVFVPTRENAIINRLNKTRVEKFPDLQEMKDEELKREREEKRKFNEQVRRQQKEEAERYAEMKHQKAHAYDELDQELEEKRAKLEENAAAAEEEEFW